MSRRRPVVLTRPEQGWSSLLLLLGMLAVLGYSVADSRPLIVIGSGSLSDSLPLLIVVAGLVGYLLARSSLGVVRAHVLGAAVAAVMLLLTAGAGLMGESPLPASAGAFTARIEAVWLRLDADISGFIAEEITTPTVTTYLVLGAICWTTAQFSAFSVFRYDRGGPAVMAVGTLLFLNVGLGSLQPMAELLPVVPVLAVFSALALLLLMRLQLVQQRYAWARRHISDATDVSRLFIRTGVAFVLIAVLGASSLTVWATVEAQEVSIDGLEEPLEDIADEVSRVLSVFGVSTGTEVPPTLGTTSELTTDWNRPDGTAFTAEFESGQLRGNYWWGSAYDKYDWRKKRWITRESETEDVQANDQLWSPTEATAGGTLPATVAVTVGEGSPRANLYRLRDAHGVDRDVVVRRVPGDGIDEIRFDDLLEEGESVRFSSFVRDYGPGSQDLTADDLRAATGPYPDWVVPRYLDGADDGRVVGEKTRAMADRIQAQYRSPYDQALAVQSELRQMRYDPSLGDACQGFDALPECLLTIERGFCQQYATTMVMVLRAMGIPARYVTGYLPGKQDADGVWTVPRQALHTWAEAYFPGYGWVRFDPTPGDVGYDNVETNFNDEAQAILDGESPEPTEPPLPTEPPAPEESLDQAFTPGGLDEPPSGSDGLIMVIGLGAITVLLLGVVSLLLLFRLRRLPGGDDSLAYRGIVSLATRLGYGPHPSQTEYEYAGTLSETIPSVRDDLYLVTDARVETAYGGGDPDAQQEGRLKGAYARIRTALLRLMLRTRR